MRISSFIASIEELQIAQLRHDVVAHQDILTQLVPKRLTHFTLHFAKYAGALSKAVRGNDEEQIRRVIVDSAIIILASANALNMNLTGSLRSLSVDSLVDKDDRGFNLVSAYVEIMGRMAKACEVLDHMENFPSRLVLEQSVSELTLVVDELATFARVDLIESIRTRWKVVEEKIKIGLDSMLPHKPDFLKAVGSP